MQEASIYSLPGAGIYNSANSESIWVCVLKVFIAICQKG